MEYNVISATVQTENFSYSSQDDKGDNLSWVLSSSLCAGKCASSYGLLNYCLSDPSAAFTLLQAGKIQVSIFHDFPS